MTLIQACFVLHLVLNDKETLGWETVMNVLNLCILSFNYRKSHLKSQC